MARRNGSSSRAIFVAPPPGRMPQLISESPNCASSDSKRQVAGEQRAVAAAEAPAVDHGDGRLLVLAQTSPPAISFALRLAHGSEALAFDLAKILLQIHPG